MAWDETSDFTQFVLKWTPRPRYGGLTAVFADEILRRRGLRAYGVKLPSRRSRINQITSTITPLVARELAKPAAA